MSVCMIHGYYRDDFTAPVDCPECATAAMNQSPIVFHGTVFPCPQCARFREKMDREKMAKVIGAAWYKYDEFEQMADALIKYLTE